MFVKEQLKSSETIENFHLKAAREKIHEGMKLIECLRTIKFPHVHLSSIFVYPVSCS